MDELQILPNHNTNVIRNIVFAGGGAKTLVYCGAIDFLEENCLLSSVENLAGSSAGAVFAAMLALGLDSDSIYSHMLHWNFDLSAEADSVQRTINFFELKGMYTGTVLIESLSRTIDESVSYIGLSSDTLTFGELDGLHDLYPSHYKHLYVTGSNTETGQLELFSHETTPDMKIIDALLISTAFPLYLVPRYYNNVMYVDGGLIDNIPFSHFDEPQFNHSGLDHNPETLIMTTYSSNVDITSLLVKFESFDNETFDYYSSKGAQWEIYNYVNELYNIYNPENSTIPNSMMDQAIKINTSGLISTLESDITSEKLDTLFAMGHDMAEETMLHHWVMA